MCSLYHRGKFPAIYITFECNEKLCLCMRLPRGSAFFIPQKYVTFKPDSTPQSACNLLGSFH